MMDHNRTTSSVAQSSPVSHPSSVAHSSSVAQSISVAQTITGNDLLGNFLRIVFDYENKMSLNELSNISAGNAFLIGSVIFLCLMVISAYLDSSLRNQIFYVFDNCTNEDYNYEYVVKIRYGLSSEFTSSIDLIIEFYSSKFRPLAKFVIVGGYLENGLNIGSKTYPGMKITTVYLFKHNSLDNLEYCRAYLKSNDPNIMIHLYSIEVGTNKEVSVFFFNHGINRSNPNATQVLTIIEEPVIIKYNGPLMEASYLQATIFIYSFFLLTFFTCRLYPTREKIQIIYDFKIDRGLLTNSTSTALVTGLLYLIFRDFIRWNYSSSNENQKWNLIEKAIVSIVLIACLYLALTSLLTAYRNNDEQTYYFYLVIYTNLTLLVWLPIAFFFFYIFSPSNYHLGRIIMKNTFHVSERSLLSKSSNASQTFRMKSTDRTGDSERETLDTESRIDDSRTKHAKIEQQKDDKTPKPQIAQSPQILQATKISPYFAPAIAYQQGAYVPIFDQTMVQQHKNHFFTPFNMPSPVTYVNDPQFTAQLATHLPVQLPVQQYEMNSNNLKFHSNLVSPYKSFKAKMQHSELSIVKPVGHMREQISKQISKGRSLDNAPFKLPASKLILQKAIRKDSSNTSLASTGSDYYAAIFKEGKVPKVGSISQYGSLLR